jgi:hypothetical protein
MRIGADYGNVCCTADAAKSIKTYAPELIVIPCMLQLSDLTPGWVRSLLMYSCISRQAGYREPFLSTSVIVLD